MKPQLYVIVALVLAAFAETQVCAQKAAAPDPRRPRSTASQPTPQDIPLDSGWEFRSLPATRGFEQEAPADTSAWHPATVPGVALTDLLAAKLIPDPFFRDNEARLQWVGLTDWEYRTTLRITPAQLVHPHLDLVFDGLDTFAEVFLNGQPVLQANNMFRTWRTDVRPLLHPGDNQLRVVLHSAITHMLPTVKALPFRLPTVVQVQDVSEEGIATDPYVRKAPYNYGWDWGPRFVTSGIWKKVHLQLWDDLRIEHLHIAQPHITSAVAQLDAQLDVVADHDGLVRIDLSAHALTPNDAPTAALHATRTVHLTRGPNHVSLPLEILHPSLWYPAGYGAQARYEFAVSVHSPRTAATATLRTGLRSVELRRENDSVGQSFFFLINGKPVFAKGADVIPFDSFAPRVTPAQHRQILQSARDANMNMVREWGGGYYESDDFYDIADELGIMVWQEFMFGGALIPGDDQIPGFRANVRAEAIDQVDRLRDHPSIVLWCGNNEVETGWFGWGDRLDFRKKLTRDLEDRVWGDYLLVMDNVLQSVVLSHAPEIPYTPSSPHSTYDAKPDLQTSGDMHFWAVWGASAPVADYNKVTPRFLSEFGFQSFPEMRTIETFALPDDLALTSPVMLAHQKNKGGNERIKTYMDAEYPTPKDFASFVFLSQVQQAEAIRVAADHLRSSRPRTMGSLFWQLNDCWPVASWSSIDSLGRWKALQFYAKRFYADLALAPYQHDGVIDTTVISDLDHPVEATLKTVLMSFTGEVYSSSVQTYAVPAASAKLVSQLTETALLGTHARASTFASLTLTVDGRSVADRTVFFDHVKNLVLPQPAITHEWSTRNGKTQLTLRSPTLARNVWISFAGHDPQLSDNSFDLIPNQPLTIEISSPLSSADLDHELRIQTLSDMFPKTEVRVVRSSTETKGRGTPPTPPSLTPIF